MIKRFTLSKDRVVDIDCQPVQKIRKTLFDKRVSHLAFMQASMQVS